MSAVAAIDNVVPLSRQPRAGLREVMPPVDASTRQADFQPWELNSELVLVCPDLRSRSLELLPDRAPELATTTPQRPIALPVSAVGEDEPDLLGVVLRFAAHRLSEAVRFGLAIIGALVLLALLAETLAH